LGLIGFSDDCTVGHVAGEGPLGSFQRRRPAVDGSVVDWWVDVVVRVTMRHKTHLLDVIWPDIKKLLPSEGSSIAPTVKFNREPMLKFHEETKVGVVDFLPWHDPTDGVVIVELMGRLFKEKRIVKKEFVRKRTGRNRRINRACRQKQNHTMTSPKDEWTADFYSPWWEAINSKLQIFRGKRK